MWYDIKERWDMGRHGYEWDACTSIKEKENWDTKEMKGWDKVLEVLESYQDWFFFQEFFTEEMIDKCNLYLWGIQETMVTLDIRRTTHTKKEIKDAIIGSFAHSRVPRIVLSDGDFRGGILLEHKHTGADLEIKNATETMKHIHNLTGRDIYLDTIIGEEHRLLVVFTTKDHELRIQVLQKLKDGKEKKDDITEVLKRISGG